MNVTYKKDTLNDEIIDPDDFYLDQLLDGFKYADKIWNQAIDSGEKYYRIEDLYCNFSCAEKSKQQIYESTIVPKEIWEIPHKAFAKLIKFNKA